MSYFEIKTLLAGFFSAAAAVAVLTMLSAMGRPEHTVRPAKLRAAHRISGYAFVAVMLVAAAMGAWYVRSVGDGVPTRGALHMTLALLLIGVVAIKVSVARYFRQFLKYMPAIGMVAFVLAFAVASLSAGFFVVTRSGVGRALQDSSPVAYEGARETDREPGARLFERHCAACHSLESGEEGIGPSLAGLFHRGSLASSGRAVTRASVAEQILEPAGSMPSFKGRLTDDEVADIVAYLEGLGGPESP